MPTWPLPNASKETSNFLPTETFKTDCLSLCCFCIFLPIWFETHQICDSPDMCMRMDTFAIQFAIQFAIIDLFSHFTLVHLAHGVTSRLMPSCQSHVDGALIAAGSPYGCGVQPDEATSHEGKPPGLGPLHLCAPLHSLHLLGRGISKV